MLSYLLFDSAYITELIELGEADAEENWEGIAPFLCEGGREDRVAS